MRASIYYILVELLRDEVVTCSDHMLVRHTPGLALV